MQIAFIVLNISVHLIIRTTTPQRTKKLILICFIIFFFYLESVSLYRVIVGKNTRVYINLL